MDRKVRERRQLVKRHRGRRRATFAVILVAVLAMVALFLWLRSSDVFAVKRVTSSAVEHVSTKDISRVTADTLGVSLLRLSTGAIESSLARLPYVRSVEVYRKFPNTLDIRLTEYEPIARLRASNGDVWLVAEDGMVLEKKATSTLPLLVSAGELKFSAGKKLPAVLISALGVVPLVKGDGAVSALPIVDHIKISSGGELTVVLEGGAELRLGDPKMLKEKLKVASAIMEQYLRDGRRVLYVDASVPDRVAVNAK